MQKKPSERIKELGLILPPAPPPAGLYKPVLVVDHFQGKDQCKMTAH